MALLEVEHLHTFFRTKRGIVRAVNDVSYTVERGKTLGIVGESGSGKSVSAMSILKLLDGNGYIDSGSIRFEGKELTTLSRNELYSIRGNAISMIFQEPMTSLHPIFTVERQVREPFMIHRHLSKKEASAKVMPCSSAIGVSDVRATLSPSRPLLEPKMPMSCACSCPKSCTVK